LRVWRNR